jgi:hypothetical protein
MATGGSAATGDGAGVDDILVTVGYSPYRKFKARTGDYVMIVAGTLVTLGLVAWAFLS